MSLSKSRISSILPSSPLTFKHPILRPGLLIELTSELTSYVNSLLFTLGLALAFESSGSASLIIPECVAIYVFVYFIAQMLGVALTKVISGRYSYIRRRVRTYHSIIANIDIITNINMPSNIIIRQFNIMNIIIIIAIIICI